MKKFAKMSLVAAVAVAGLTSYASAGSLEEAVKDTTVSGYLRYRFNTDHENSADTVNNAKIVATLKTKVNDNVSASVKFSAEAEGTSFTVPVTQMYFTYVNGALTAKVGRTHLVSPLTDNGNNGDGVILTYGLGPVTLAGAYYNGIQNHTNNKSTGTGNLDSVAVYGVGALGSIEMVNLAAWYLATDDQVKTTTTTGLASTTTAAASKDAYALSADAKFGPIGANIMYAAAEEKTAAGAKTDDISYLQIGVNGSMGIVSANLDYVKTGKNGGDTTLDGDVDAAVNLGLLVNDLMFYADIDAWHVGVSVAATPEITLAAHYVHAEDDANNEVDEYELNGKYQMSKNFYVLGRYSFGEGYLMDAGKATQTFYQEDFANSRIELMYTF